MSPAMQNWMARIAPRARRIGVLMLLYGAASIASAQWAWRDENGRTVYSDQPPPASVRAGSILRQPVGPVPSEPSDSREPGAQPSSNGAPPKPAPNPAASAAPRPPTIAEREQEFRKRMKERADSEKKLADAQSQAAEKSEDCERARGYLKSLDDGVRLVRTNADGSRELMDEAQRAAEGQRAREIVETRCN
jgi:type IV secretory pathway VirB10-like protein